MPANPFQFNPQDVIAFVLALMRVAGIFLTAPVFSSRNIPVMVKASWILLITFLIFPVLDFKSLNLPATGLPMILGVGRELLIGFSIGLGATLLFAGIQLAGQIIDIQMGLGMVNIIDPVTSVQISIMGQYYFLVATLVFLSINGHYFLIEGVVDSFQVLPLGQAHLTAALGTEMMHLFTKMFFVAFRVGAPVIGALFITNLALGVVARTVPQMNVFIVGMPLNLAVGFLVTAASMSFFVYILQGLFRGMAHDLAVLQQALQ